VGARLALDAIDRMEAGTLAPGQKQDPAQVTKAPKLTKEHGLLDWSRPAAEVCWQVRAMQPWPTAYTWWHRAGQQPLRLIVYRARARPRAEAEKALTPGQIVVSADPNVLGVAAGEGGVVEVLELQPAGKRRMAAQEFLRGRRPQAGDYLGPEAP
jgi:methionyl-tRNA formyltransferase